MISSGTAQSITLCQMSQLAEKRSIGVTVSGLGKKVIVVLKAGNIFAWLDACPHYPQGTPMAWRTGEYLNGDGTYIACHSHGALFDIQTGVCLKGPCLGAGLTPVVIAVRDDGTIEMPIKQNLHLLKE